MSETVQPYNAANPAHVKSRKRREERDQKRDDEARRWVMSSAVGRHFVWLVLSEAGMFRQPFTGTSQTDFNCGRMDVGLKLQKQLIENFAKEHVLMWSEHLTLEEQERKLDAAARVETDNGEVVS